MDARVAGQFSIGNAVARREQVDQVETQFQKLEPAAVITGEFLADGQLVNGTLRLYSRSAPRSSSSQLGEGVIDSDGRFEIAGLPPTGDLKVVWFDLKGGKHTVKDFTSRPGVNSLGTIEFNRD